MPSYNAASSLTSLINGNSTSFAGITNSLLYNPRLQLCRITAYSSGSVPGSCTDAVNHGNLMDRGYNYNFGAADNGDVLGITNYRDATRSQSFTYDALNRVASGWSAANTGAMSWGETYSIDPWGNLMIAPMVNKASGGNFQRAGDFNNRAAGLGYDAAGNMTNYTAPGQYVYDPENRISSTGGMSYTYDASGERVLKSNTSTGAAVKLYWTGAGNIVAEADGSGALTAEYIYFGGKRVARIDLLANSTHYYLSDHLSSTSVVASAAGAIEEESDYSSFGTEYAATGGPNRYKFTGKERDLESGLDYFGARYYSNGLGRFITPDPLLNSGHPGDPQSWNRYTYTLNSPLRYTDPTGLYTFGNCKSDKDTCEGYRKRFRQSVDNLKKSAGELKKGSDERKKLDSIIKKLGAEGKGGPKIDFGDAGHDKNGDANMGQALGGTITINYEAVDHQAKGFGLSPLEATALDTGLTAHESAHLAKVQLPGLSLIMHGERTALFAESATYQGLHNTDRVFHLWNEAWAGADRQQIETKRNENIQKELDRQHAVGKEDNPQK